MKSKVNLTIENGVAADARALGLNMSKLAEEAIAEAIKLERNRLWMKENKAALSAYAKEIEEEGLPLDKYRQF